jgi:hypothetical protein
VTVALWYGAGRTPKDTSRVAGQLALRKFFRPCLFKTDVGSYPLGNATVTCDTLGGPPMSRSGDFRSTIRD